MTLQLPELQHDCNACSGLCCVVLPFDADQGFGFDKEALTPCRHLRDDFACGIHTELDAKGFKGCIHYTCHGAGQRVTRAFGESNWRSNPDKAHEIYAMFSSMQRLHALQALLHTALGALGEGDWKARLLAQQQQLEQLCVQLEQQRAADVETAIAQVHALLRQLQTAPTIVAIRTARQSG
ncbi:MAG TPA: hypothetical protein VMH83_10575 [Candidatus Acidoferrum sp.]|nr:hypothetical protein [Candidatus Acidoferrum sp.]